MQEIVQILMTRDGATKDEAIARIKECRRRLRDEACISGDWEEAADIIADELGLEPDYMMVLL